MLPNLAHALAYHCRRPQLAEACAALDLPQYGTLEALAERASGWVDTAVGIRRRRRLAAVLLEDFPAETLRGLAGYVLERPKGRAKADLARALARRFVPEPEEALAALGFEVMKEGGEGASGAVYACRRPGHGNKLFAAKVALGDRRTHAQEAVNLARLRHPNILQYFSDFPGTVPVIVTEWCGAGTLTQRIGKEKIHRSFTVAHVAKEVCGALAYLHENGVFHRDLHPGNVLFRNNGDIVVADFGLSRRKGLRPRIRQYNNWLGDPAKAPDGAYDVYMLGRILVSMRKGRIGAWSQSDVPALSAHRDFWMVVRAALNAKPSRRPTAAEIVTAVDADFSPAALHIGARRLIAAP